MKKRILSIFIIFTLIVAFFSFTGCSTKQKINVDDIDRDNVKVRIDMCGGYGLVQYVTILTYDDEVISFNGREDTEATVRLLDSEKTAQQFYIQRCLEELRGCESDGIDFFVEASDTYYIEMYFCDKVYRFTYGCAKNPYANILTEILLGYSEVEELNGILPYPSQFR